MSVLCRKYTKKVQIEIGGYSTVKILGIFIDGYFSAITDGRINISVLEDEDLSQGDLLMLLREEGVENLGDVRRSFFEQSGRISVFPFKDGKERFGLSIVPPLSTNPPPGPAFGEKVKNSAYYACALCGSIKMHNRGEMIAVCERCKGKRWTAAMKVE